MVGCRKTPHHTSMEFIFFGIYIIVVELVPINNKPIGGKYAERRTEVSHLQLWETGDVACYLSSRRNGHTS